MTRYFFLSLALILNIAAFGQELTGDQLLEKAISFHDPNNNWPAFKGKLFIEMETPNSSLRKTEVQINFPANFFKSIVSKDGNVIESELNNGDCTIKLNGSTEIDQTDIKELNLTCERAEMMKNYYTYLYGLPMKLKNPGTIIDKKVVKKSFKGKEYLVLKVKYDENVGKDTWYFYFDPSTYAMEVYQFYHDESKNDGEYILLKGTTDINDIKMPKVRSWYYNNDDKYLGTDTLTKVSELN
ncbi:hypothetical protein J8L85_03995 [Maribacter sp. MMG018]|uniref:DUF6503 family protein n=1 Tax=Maribacter sp. MMG018 TaxID=2822688 RepID=UPI001B38E541|nr:DUF6503 family protein [Maribacter sp. MMG018]MBQ4913585.1 hypothetical protein [Maribacter sp. MMG018]